MKKGSTVVIALILALGAVSSACGQLHLHLPGLPRCFGDRCRGISDAETIVGHYSAASGAYCSLTLLGNGIYTTLHNAPIPGAMLCMRSLHRGSIERRVNVRRAPDNAVEETCRERVYE